LLLLSLLSAPSFAHSRLHPVLVVLISLLLSRSPSEVLFCSRLEGREALRHRLAVLVRGMLVKSNLAGGAQEGSLAGLALDVEGLLVGLELRLGRTRRTQLCVALALLRSLGAVTTTHLGLGISRS